LLVTGCAASSGQPAARIAEPDIAAAYIPLVRRFDLGLEKAAGAAVVFAPGIAATNAHNANLIDRKDVIGQVQDYDLLYFRTARSAQPATAEPVVGAMVTAYGEDTRHDLRVAHGTVRQIVTCAGCDAPAYFTFAADAGPGFSGGPVVDASGHLVGITFGFKDEGGKRLIYAYDMRRVQAEFSRLSRKPIGATN